MQRRALLRGALGLGALAPLAGLSLAGTAKPGSPRLVLMILRGGMDGLAAVPAVGDLVVVHATGLPYRERSHFDAQQVLESGGERPFALDTGWLARALNGGRGKGMAFQSAVPLALRGHAEVDTWAPSTRPDPAPDLVARLERLYADDPALATALSRARSLRSDMPEMVMARDMAGNTPGTARPAAPVAQARQAAGFLVEPAGP
ncbi:MAG: hypothetical protein CFE45_25120, partial [Burkholderiales bacterium PBB5]